MLILGRPNQGDAERAWTEISSGRRTAAAADDPTCGEVLHQSVGKQFHFYGCSGVADWKTTD